MTEYHLSGTTPRRGIEIAPWLGRRQESRFLQVQKQVAQAWRRSSVRVFNRPRHKRLRFAFITSDLAISSVPDAKDWSRLSRAGISAVIDLRNEGMHDPDLLGRLELEYFRLPIAEGNAPTVEDLERATSWVAGRIGRGKVLIHCRAGRGRSTLVACATLVHLGHKVSTAYALVRQAHPTMELSTKQTEALAAFATRRQAAKGKSPDVLSAQASNDDPYLDPEQSRLCLGASNSEFDSLMKQYGVGRYHLPERLDQVFYAKADLNKVKTALAQLGMATKAALPPPEDAGDR